MQDWSGEFSFPISLFLYFDPNLTLTAVFCKDIDDAVSRSFCLHFAARCYCCDLLIAAQIAELPGMFYGELFFVLILQDSFGTD